MMFSENDIASLRDKVRLYMSRERFIHTIGVEDMARTLGEIYLDECIDELRCAAILHDAAKELDVSEQLSLIRDGDYVLAKEDLMCLPCLHAFAAPELIKRDFSGYATDNILSAVFKHTTGHKEMSLFDEIIFLSDYIELGRKYPSCTEVRSYLFSYLDECKSIEEKTKALHTAVLMAIDNTINTIKKRDGYINKMTFMAKDTISALI